MTELIIIKTDNSQEIKKLLAEKQIDYEVYSLSRRKKSFTRVTKT